MKNFFKWISAMLTMFVLVTTATLVSCSDDNEKVNVSYNLGFSKVNTSSPDALSEMSEIEASYKKALGITDGTFTKFGTVKECDQQVLNACRQAEKALDGKSWKGTYVFEITNANSLQVIYSKKFKANDDNALL